MLGPFFHVPSVDGKGTKVAWTVAWPALVMGAVITLLAVTGLTHRQSYGDIFAITLTKTAAVLVVIAVYYLTGIT